MEPTDSVLDYSVIMAEGATVSDAAFGQVRMEAFGAQAFAKRRIVKWLIGAKTQDHGPQAFRLCIGSGEGITQDVTVVG